MYMCRFNVHVCTYHVLVYESCVDVLSPCFYFSLQDLLNPRGNKTTVECQKVQEYISECLRGAQRDVDSSNGAVMWMGRRKMGRE